MAGEELKIRLELKCLCDDSVTQQTLLFSPIPEAVVDIKERIETELCIPKSCQSLFLPGAGGAALGDAEKVAGLYVRSGDTLRVEYLDEADVEEIRGAVQRSLRPARQLLRSNSSLNDARKIQKKRNSDALLSSCQSVLHELGYKSLLPWSSARTVANRQYMLQEGVVDLVLEIYAVLLPLPWDWRGHLLQNLEICCLAFLWNFSETRYARQLVADKGGFDMMLKSLMHQSEEEFLRKYAIHDIFDVAVGCVSNFCELECCQMPMSENVPALQRLLHFALHGPSINLFTKMLISNLFFRLSHNCGTHKHLTQKSISEKLLRFGTDHRNVAIGYILGVTYARLIIFSLDSIDQGCLQQMVDFMKSFLLQMNPDIVTELEERFQYNWITMRPFVDAVYSNGATTTKLSDIGLHKSKPSGTFTEEKQPLPSAPISSVATTVSVAYLLFALKVETARTANAELLVNQGLLEYITMLHWGLDCGWQTQCRWVQEEVKKVSGKLPVPRLSLVAKATLARTMKEHSGQIET